MITKDDIIEDYKEGQRERERRREINKSREEIRRGSKEEVNKTKKIKLADLCREIIQEIQFEWAIRKLKYKTEKGKREKEEEGKDSIDAKKKAIREKLKEKDDE